ncbi:hypothetical protein OQA88_9513 [Cercophora sp. LCS_1]
MDQMDLSQLPPGLAPELAYNSLQVGTCIAFGVTYFFCTVFLVLRFVQAIKIVRKIELDLIILTISYGAALVYFITMVDIMRHGWGRNITELNTTDLMNFNKALLPNTLTYLITPAVTKMAILVVLFKINPSVIYRWIVAGVGFAIFAYTFALTYITGDPCNPLKEGKMQCLMGVALAQSVLNIASDLAVIILPIPTIHSLQLSMKQKVTVACILALGSAVIVCSIARLPYVLILPNDPNITYTEAVLGVWSIVEVNLGIFCGSAMRLKPLIVRYLPMVGLGTSGKRSTTKTFGNTTGPTPLSSRGNGKYHLHSIQKSSVGDEDKNIHVYTEFDVRTENGSRMGSRLGDRGDRDSNV